MADSKTTQLAQLAATPDVADQLMIVDVSDTSMAASGTNKKLAASYVARSDAGAKLITGNARELTVPATGTAALLEQINTFTVSQVMPLVRSGAPLTLLDDTAVSINMGTLTGIIILVAGLSTLASGAVVFRTGTNLMCATVASAAGTKIVPTTATVLTGTSGVDGNFTVSAHSNGNLYLENRTGTSFAMTYLVIGG